MWKFFNFKTGNVIRNIHTIDDNIILDSRGDDSASLTIPMSSMSSEELQNVHKHFRPHRGMAWVVEDGGNYYVPFAGWISSYRINTEEQTISVQVASVKDYYEKVFVIPHDVDQIDSTNDKWTIEDVSPKGYIETLIGNTNQMTGTPSLPPAGGSGMSGNYKKVHAHSDMTTVKAAIDECANEKKGIEMRWNYGYDDISDIITFTPRYPASDQRLVGITTRRNLNFQNQNVIVTSIDSDRDYSEWYNHLWDQITVDGGEEGDIIDIALNEAEEWDDLPRSDIYTNFNSALTPTEREDQVKAMLKAAYKPHDNWEVNVWVQDSIDTGGAAVQFDKKMTWTSNSTSWLGNKVQIKGTPDEFTALMGVQRCMAMQFSTHSPIVTLQLADLRTLYPAIPKRTLPKDKKSRNPGDDGGGWDIDDPIDWFDEDPDWPTDDEDGDGSGPVANPIYGMEIDWDNDVVQYPTGSYEAGKIPQYGYVNHLAKGNKVFGIYFKRASGIGITASTALFQKDGVPRGSGSSLQPISHFNDNATSVNLRLCINSGQLNSITGEIDDYQQRAELEFTPQMIYDLFYKVAPEGQPMGAPYGRLPDGTPRDTHEKIANDGSIGTTWRHRWSVNLGQSFVTDYAIYVGLIMRVDLYNNLNTRVNCAQPEALTIYRWIVVTNTNGQYDGINNNSFVISPTFMRVHWADQTGVWAIPAINNGLQTGNFKIITQGGMTSSFENISWSDSTNTPFYYKPWAIINGLSMPMSMNVTSSSGDWGWQDAVPSVYDDNILDPKQLAFGLSSSSGNSSAPNTAWVVGWSPVNKNTKCLYGFVKKRNEDSSVFIGEDEMTGGSISASGYTAIATVDLDSGAPRPLYTRSWVTKRITSKNPTYLGSIPGYSNSDRGYNIPGQTATEASEGTFTAYGIPFQIWESFSTLSSQMRITCLTRSFVRESNNDVWIGVRTGGSNYIICTSYGMNRSVGNVTPWVTDARTVTAASGSFSYHFYGGRLWRFPMPNRASGSTYSSTSFPFASMPLIPHYTPPVVTSANLSGTVAEINEAYTVPMNPWVLL